MPVHFTPEEMVGRRRRAAGAIRDARLDALLCFKQESMYWLTGYDSFGFSLFQCLIVTADGNVTLLTRLPDLRQARHTSNIEDIRIWKDTAGMNPARDLRALLDELGLGAARLGVELDSYGLKASNWRLIEAELAGRCTLTDASTLIDRLRAVKSAREIEDDADASHRARPSRARLDARRVRRCAARLHGGDPSGPADGRSLRRSREGPGRGGPARAPLERLRLRNGRRVQPAMGRSANVPRGQPSADAGRQRVLPAHDRDELRHRARHDPQPLGAGHR